MTIDIGSLGSSATPLALPVNPGGQMGKDEFLKMLVAQLKNQDPMSPMKGDDMAAQLAQFSSLEQLTNIGKALEGQAALQEGLIASINDTTAMNVLGKTVLAVGDQLQVRGDGSEAIRFEVGGSGGLASVRILNAQGHEVAARDLGFVTAGHHEFDVGSAVDGLPAGAYRFVVDVVDTAGKPVASQSFVTATIDGVRYGPSGPVLASGDVKIPFGTVLEITDN